MKPYVKIGLVSLAIVVVGLIVYLVWSSLAGPEPVPVPPDSGQALPIGGVSDPGSQNQNASITTPTGSSVTKISDNPVFEFWIDPGTKEVYYITTDGLIFSAKDGADLQITRGKMSAINSARPSPNSQRVLAAFGDPRLPQWAVFDVIDEVWRPLPEGILNATWGGNSDTLLAFVKNGGNINLSSIDISKNPVIYKTLVKDLRFQEVVLKFIPPNNLLVSESPSANYPSSVWSVNLKNLSIFRPISPENGLSLEVSTDGSVVLVFSTSGGFRILNAGSFGQLAPTPFTTLPSKCTRDSASIYCFVPEGNAFNDSVLPDDYFKRRVYTSDSLFRIDVAADEIGPVSIPQNPYGSLDAEKPILSGGSIYFKNRVDGSLYTLKF
jgi:hypothetical protein